MFKPLPFRFSLSKDWTTIGGKKYGSMRMRATSVIKFQVNREQQACLENCSSQLEEIDVRLMFDDRFVEDRSLKESNGFFKKVTWTLLLRGLCKEKKVASSVRNAVSIFLTRASWTGELPLGYSAYFSHSCSASTKNRMFLI